ncbi:MAG: 8-oxo-dGTP pyrophosphatase MutT (NUDIX family) [Candidatus Paceibacteria bacterium]|jgi:8-oxo-dGTP pyrophosphatase MutT (NUDIX family)
MNKKRGSLLIPYYFNNEDLYVFLQRRSDEAPLNPGTLGGFGGGLEENENNEEALVREIREELEYSPKDYLLLETLETDYSISNYYIEKVDEDFAKKITVNEGKQGEWHRAVTLSKRNDVIRNVKKAAQAMLEKLKN